MTARDCTGARYGRKERREPDVREALAVPGLWKRYCPGPAASVLAGRGLTDGEDYALIIDIGGTTTDICRRQRHGRPVMARLRHTDRRLAHACEGRLCRHLRPRRRQRGAA